jgi:3-hydroxyisobutyrate dehydrogenase
MLPDSNVVKKVLYGDKDALAAHLKPGSVVIDMSSSSPSVTRELGPRLKAAGVDLIDAPVSGGVKRAVDGSLAIMAGGEAAVIARVKPLFLTMGKSVIETGMLGSGHAMKALNNYVSAAGLLAACEALKVGEDFGIAPDKIVAVLNASTGKNNSTENKLMQFIDSGAFNSGFALALMKKDINIATDLAQSLGSKTLLGEVLPHDGAVPLKDEVEDRTANHLLRRGTQHPRHLRVHKSGDPSEISHPDAFEGRLDN